MANLVETFSHGRQGPYLSCIISTCTIVADGLVMLVPRTSADMLLIYLSGPPGILILVLNLAKSASKELIIAI